MNKGPLFPFHDVTLKPKKFFLNMSLFSTPCQIQCYLVYVILLFTDPISYSYALFRKCEMWWKDYLMHKKETHNKETCSFMEVYTFIRFLFTTDMFWLWLQLLKHYSIKWMCSTAKNHCVTRAPLLYFIRRWVAKFLQSSEWVSQASLTPVQISTLCNI